MRKLAILAVLAAFMVAGCGGGSDSPPGNPAVYERIEQTTSCAKLQAEFDRAETRGDEIGIAYMKAADDRMQEVGCYGEGQ